MIDDIISCGPSTGLGRKGLPLTPFKTADAGETKKLTQKKHRTYKPVQVLVFCVCPLRRISCWSKSCQSSWAVYDNECCITTSVCEATRRQPHEHISKLLHIVMCL